MPLDPVRHFLWKRAAKREYRRLVREWYSDGGDERFRFDYDLGPDSLVLDLGGYEGQWASDLYARHRCRIHVFEPVTAFAERIRARFANNPDIDVHAFGLGGETRGETINVGGASSSVHRKRAGAENIRIVDVDAWLDENGVGSAELIKVNIEGGEYELLERLLETGRVADFRDLQVQFHNFWPDCDRRMQAIQAELEKTHEPTYQYRFVWENWRRKT